MKCPVILGAILGAVLSNANAFTLNLDFPQGTPATIDFAYAVSTGDCSSSTLNCSFSQASYGGIKGSYIHKFMRDMNSTFELMTPVEDRIHTPTNFTIIKVKGLSGVCRINLLGKKIINVKVNKDGSCVE